MHVPERSHYTFQRFIHIISILDSAVAKQLLSIYPSAAESPPPWWVCGCVLGWSFHWQVQASWLEQVYRRRSHRTELCTWLWTRYWWVKPLPPSLPLVFFFPVSVSLSLPVSLYSLFARSHSPSHSALERLRLHGYLHPLPSGRFFVSVGRHRWHTHK